MSTTTVTTGHVTAALYLPRAARTGPALAAADRLPGGWHLHPASTGTCGAAPKVTVEHTTTTSTVTVRGHRVRLRLSPAATRTSTLAYLIYTALERARQQRQMTTVHANAVISPAGHSVLLLGAKSAGKTAVTLALGERGCTHAGDDLSVLPERNGELELWPGKPTAAVRQATRPAGTNSNPS